MVSSRGAPSRPGSRLPAAPLERSPLTCVSLLVNTSGFTEHLLEPPKHPVVLGQVIFLMGAGKFVISVFYITSWLGLEVHLPFGQSRAEMCLSILPPFFSLS